MSNDLFVPFNELMSLNKLYSVVEWLSALIDSDDVFPKKND